MERLQPAMAKALLDEVRTESEFRRQLETRRLEAEIASQARGQVFGLVSCLAAFLTAGYAAYHGAEWIGSIVGGGTILGILSIFVLGRTYGNTK